MEGDYTFQTPAKEGPGKSARRGQREMGLGIRNNPPQNRLHIFKKVELKHFPSTSADSDKRWLWHIH